MFAIYCHHGSQFISAGVFLRAYDRVNPLQSLWGSANFDEHAYMELRNPHIFWTREEAESALVNLKESLAAHHNVPKFDFDLSVEKIEELPVSLYKIVS